MGSRDSIARRDSGRYEYYPLDVKEIALIPDEHEIVVNPKSGLALLIDWENREVITESQFEPQACKVIMKLLNDWPTFVPYEKLLPLIRNESYTELAQRLEVARLTDTLEPLIAPLVAILNQCKPALARVGLAVYPMLEHGYLLMSASDPSQQSDQDEAERNG